ncbi:TPA: DUF1496 domain-containing protein [Klebsiella pneumoniae]|uniref:DUF1496 domain-containing protein n=1 Tax=Klebsiella pneumoniae TaxID=573 RepID=UPI001FF907CD|nr:DUF1496 domain-containing protein [Klebsiella pneumoniae]MCJ6790483.1 DUF1496 domain-containing protein [Klebsiella pneumoniae]UPF69793.1 DUF1496 domain-containing protein [Klebsiella pneumoniae subsp. pneumoniae]HBS0521286.1 DUF1496 domain-containing protein [Klebsiella pneumoniae]HBS2311024.1 DUF1496 domain-containing protein [Klebsiella pneumoniae]
MKKIILAGLLVLPFVASANSIQPSQVKQESDKSTLTAKKATRQNQNICVYEGKDYSQGSRITVSAKVYECVDHKKIVMADEEKTFDMRWERVPDHK